MCGGAYTGSLNPLIQKAAGSGIHSCTYREKARDQLRYTQKPKSLGRHEYTEILRTLGSASEM
jgi:hypothetical protein